MKDRVGETWYGALQLEFSGTPLHPLISLGQVANQLSQVLVGSFSSGRHLQEQTFPP